MGLVAALLDDGGELGRMMQLIRIPADRPFTQKAYQDTGITQAMIDRSGVSLDDAMREFALLMGIADWVAAYSVEHHAAVVNNAALQCDVDLPNVALYCLMKKATNVCKLPARTPNTYKMPKFTEAYAHFAGKNFAIPYDGTALEILDCHLRARNLILRGIKLAEQRELRQASKPLVGAGRRRTT
jgi:DNA polymerase III epsilon subunit-like protein